VLGLAAELLRHIDAMGHLPANFGAAPHRLGINHLHVALAEGILQLAEGVRPIACSFRRTPRCPPMAEEIGRRFLSVAEGELVDPDLGIDALYRHGKLQTWTLKPALRGGP